MNLQVYQYRCENGHTFDAPSLGDFAYGEFLLWSRAGEMAYLHAINDPSYKEMDLLVRSTPKCSSLKPSDRARVLQRIYGTLACDPDSHGNPFRIGAICPCPRCGTELMEQWSAKVPNEMIEIRVNSVTHLQWDSLTRAQKIEKIDSELDQLWPDGVIGTS